MSPRGSPRAGCSYFGVRLVRHVRADMEDLSRRGFTGVLHTFSENDLQYYRETMREIVAVSHGAGLEVQVAPWGVGRTFGGEAESRFVTLRPEACQVLDDGRRAPTGCLNNPEYRSFCKAWADAALEIGADRVFWDEPHWTVPEHVAAEPTRWACRCPVCLALYRDRVGEEMPSVLTPEVLAFRERSTVDFLAEMLAHVEARGGSSTVCLLPLTEGPHGIGDWAAVASLPGLDTFATDPYWKVFGEPAGPFVGRFARLLLEVAKAHGLSSQLWLPSFGLVRADIPDLEAAVAAARDVDVDELWTWGYEACGHMSSLATSDAASVWEAVSRALTGGEGAAGADLSRLSTEAHRVELLDLDLRPTLDLVRTINAEDRTVPDAVAAAAEPLADAIDAIVTRLRDGGRLVYVGAGTSGRLAAVDAAECGPTFGCPPEQVVAIVAGGLFAPATEQEAAEDDRGQGQAALDELELGSSDAVVALSASGRTPYVLGAVERAREAGALTVGVVCVTSSQLARLVEHEIAVVVGPEVIAGSTRMKAGTAQKLVLNTISTAVMVRLGKTFGNLMVDVVASNGKLRARARRTVAQATGADEEAAAAAIDAAGGEVKTAIVALLGDLDARTARARLAAAGGVVRDALR